MPRSCIETAPLSSVRLQPYLSKETLMKPSKLYEALHALIGEGVPLHIWGACGVGKSQIVAEVANDLDYDFLDVRTVQLDPVDLRGLPRIAEDQTEWVPPKFLPTTGKGILFLDELTSAPQMTQAGCYMRAGAKIDHRAPKKRGEVGGLK